MHKGKFANGAATAAFSYAMSWAASKYKPGGAPPDECSASNTCTKHDFSEEQKKEILAKIKELTVDTRAGNYKSAENAAVALHTNKDLMSYSEELGIEFWAVIDGKSSTIKEIGTGFSSGYADGVFEGTYRGGDAIWHSHPTGSPIHSGDWNAAYLGGGRGAATHIFASGRKLTGYNLNAHILPFKNDWECRNYRGSWNVREITYQNKSWSYRDGAFSK